MRIKELVGIKTLVGCAALLLAPGTCLAETATQIDLRRGVPTEAHLAIFGQHNPERDYQRAYLAEVCQTFEQEKIVERLIKIVSERMSQTDLENTRSAIDEIKGALEPVDWEAVLNCQEVVYSQIFQIEEMPANQHLVLLRMEPAEAQQLHTGMKNLLGLIEKYSGGRTSLLSETEGEAELTILELPGRSPITPTFAQLDGVFLFATTTDIARQSLKMLQGGEEPSKFDDPRLLEALASLPEPEDALVFFDGQLLFKKLEGIGDFVERVSNEDPDALRAAGLIKLVFDELQVFDYEISVEYTEQYQNRTASLTKLLPGADQKLLGKVMLGGKPFEQWQRWIPADAVAYSLGTGARLHPLYEGIIELLKEQVPESVEPLERFEQFQAEIGVHLDRDILQSFSGESVSITLPSSSGQGGHDSVTAVRCQNPERIKELLHRLVDTLVEMPALQAQELSLEPCEDLEDFEELSAAAFAMFQVQPVIGFQDGWMICGTNAEAVRQVLDARSGDAEAIDASAEFQKFKLEIQGPVDSLSYTNLEEGTQHTANTVRQIGAMAPMIIGMVGQDADPEELRPVQEIFGLLPGLANVIEKFDFYQASLSVVQSGEQPNTYLSRSVTLVRPPGESADEDN